jgi:hypothetical protein
MVATALPLCRGLLLYSDAAEGLNLVWEAAMGGHAGARTVLADLADKLTARGGDWRRMKYVKRRGRVER